MRKILIFILCFCTLFLCFVIPSFADEGITPRAVPTDLTGYTVVVPSNWTASAGYGIFDSFSFTATPSGSTYQGIALGYVFDFGASESPLVPTSNVISTGSTGDVLFRDGQTFTITILAYQSFDSRLIDWFVANDATFIAPTPPQPETSTIAGGIYHFKQFGDLPDIPNAGWSDGEGYTYSYTVAGKMVTTARNYNFTTFNVTFDEYVSNSYYTVTFSVDTDVGTLNLATYTASYGQVTLVQREGFKYIVLDEALIGTYDDIEFIRDFLVSGLPIGDTSPTDNPWLYILDMIIEALKVDLFGYFSVWDVFTTICGIFIVTWLLKLLAGG